MKIIFSELLEKTNIIESLQHKLEQKESEFTSMKNELHRGKICGICFDQFTSDNRAMVFFPCGHADCCQSCFHSLPNPKKCPECRIKIQKATVLFY